MGITQGTGGLYKPVHLRQDCGTRNLESSQALIPHLSMGVRILQQAEKCAFRGASSKSRKTPPEVASGGLMPTMVPETRVHLGNVESMRRD